MTSIEGARIGVFVSGGLSSWMVAKYLKDHGADVVALWADVGQYDDACLDDLFEELTGAGIELVRVDLKPQLARFGLELLSYGAHAHGPRSTATGGLNYALCRGLAAEVRRQHCRFFSHGGNDDRAFTKHARYFMPDIDRYDPWSDPDLACRLARRERIAAYLRTSRNAALVRARAQRSTDSSLLGTCYRDAAGEDPETDFVPPRPLMSLEPWAADAGRVVVDIGYRQAVVSAIDGRRRDAADLLSDANRIAGHHGISVKTAFDGCRRRVHESPGLDLLERGLRALRQLALSAEERAGFRELSEKIGDAVHAGEYHTAQCRRWRRQIRGLSVRLSGKVRIELYRGTVRCTAIWAAAGAAVVALQPRGVATGGHVWPLPPAYAQQALAS